MMTEEIKIDTIHLFPVLDKRLLELLRSLTDEEWAAQTIAKRWKVKDVAAHLLDGNLRGLSISRDGWFGEKADNLHTYQDLVAFLNNINLQWTEATKRLSPRLLTELLEISGKQYTAHLQQLNPFENAVFPVAWAGQGRSSNWFHIAREYTEKFLHQQQIRDAVNKQGLLTKELYVPFLDTLMHALPYTFKNTPAENGTIVSVVVSTDIGGQWTLVKENNGWSFTNDQTHVAPASQVIIDPDTAWKLFSKSWTAEQVIDIVQITGDRRLGEQVLRMVAVMA